MADDKILHSFKKTATEEVRAIIREYRGRLYFDLRVYYVDNDGEWRPTRKGIALSAEFLPEIKQCIDKFEGEIGAKAEK
ncbi:MAG: transcriptional coactivator p15/PC4 family protein [Pseudomonadota bacterium]